jgi:hypothetical protein
VACLQYVIDSICSKLTVETMYELIRVRLNQGSFELTEIIPVIQREDRSLDYDSAKMLAEAACGALAQRGDIRIGGDSIFAAQK